MPRRRGQLWPAISSWANLSAAHHRATSARPSADLRTRARVDREALLLELRRRLHAGWWPQRLEQFSIHDPKRRVVHVSPFVDRVAHHAIMRQLAPVLEARMFGSCHACRRGKGIRTTIAAARGMSRVARYFQRLDVAQFFASIRHNDVMTMLRGCVKDRTLLRVCQRILAVQGLASPLGPGRGLPLGSLTSQWFANALLTPLDRFIRVELGMRHQARYMDDILLLSDDIEDLRAAHGRIAEFLHDSFDLRLKASASVRGRCRDGFAFLGWRIQPGRIRLLQAKRRRIIKRYRAFLGAWHAGYIDDSSLVDRSRALFAQLGGRPGLGQAIVARVHDGREADL